MTAYQHIALTTADAEGRLRVTDRRVISALLRRGWVAEHRHRRGKRRWWTITQAGRDALAADPIVQAPRPRVHWRSHWDITRHTPGRYTVDTHTLLRPARPMLWRVLCPDRHPENPIGYRDTLADAIELLNEHLVRDHPVRDFAPTEATADGKEQP
jgi:hypothetical protein